MTEPTTGIWLSAGDEGTAYFNWNSSYDNSPVGVARSGNSTVLSIDLVGDVNGRPFDLTALDLHLDPFTHSVIGGAFVWSVQVYDDGPLMTSGA